MPDRRTRLPDGRWLALAAALLLVPALILALVSRSSGGGDAGHGGGDHRSDDRADVQALDVDALGMEHVHGLGVNPADGQLFAATHFGVFAVSSDGTATRVGSAQDTMGFTVTGPDTFLGSGHPDFSEDDEPLLGLIESTDAGRTWSPLSLRGEADFHTLRLAHGKVFGFDSTSGTLMVTSDRTQWESLSQLPLRDFAVSPERPDLLVGTTQQGPVSSDDGGRTWQVLEGSPSLVVLAWPRADVLYGADVDGGVHVSSDGGRTWTLQGQAGGAPEALASPDAQPLDIHVAVADRGIVTSSDGGRSFDDLYRQQ
jgi:hypothetical protein